MENGTRLSNQICSTDYLKVWNIATIIPLTVICHIQNDFQIFLRLRQIEVAVVLNLHRRENLKPLIHFHPR
jgi:hypothetical protein